MSGMLGKKIGMTRIFNDAGVMIPVTVIEAGPCKVTQIKSGKTDGYNAVQLGFDEKKEKRTNKPVKGHFAKAKTKPLRILKEFGGFDDEKLKLGDDVTVGMFSAGDEVKISGTSKGAGFAGVVKRHGFGGGPVTHGQSDRLRAPGSLGQSSSPSRVFKGQKLPGRKGNKRSSVLGLQIVKVNEEKNYLFVRGSVPGARNSIVEIHKK